MAFIEAYVTNLGKYNEGELASEPLKFPTTTEEVQALLKRIGVDNIQYEEIFIADYAHSAIRARTGKIKRNLPLHLWRGGCVLIVCSIATLLV